MTEHNAGYPTAQTPPAPEEGERWEVRPDKWFVGLAWLVAPDGSVFRMSKESAEAVKNHINASLTPSDFWRNPTLPANQPPARGASTLLDEARELLAGQTQLMHEAMKHPGESAADCKLYTCPATLRMIARIDAAKEGRDNG